MNNKICVLEFDASKQVLKLIQQVLLVENTLCVFDLR